LQKYINYIDFVTFARLKFTLLKVEVEPAISRRSSQSVGSSPQWSTAPKRFKHVHQALIFFNDFPISIFLEPKFVSQKR
jgi:hypothetical protein